MILPDVNVLIYSFRTDNPRHTEYRAWLQRVVQGPNPFAISEFVLAAVIRLVTNPRVFRAPSSLREAVAFASAIRDNPLCVPLSPGPRHWSIFVDLCVQCGAKGPVVPDAYLAALAIETASEWITTDQDFARFPGLHWRHPLD